MRRSFSIIGAALLCSTLAYSAVDYSRTREELSEYIAEQLDLTGASSLALVLMDGDQVVFSEGFGLADPVEGILADTDTIYCIGSISKTFAAFSAMRWWDRGQLGLDEPVTNIIPEFTFLERFPGSPPITPRLLMNHQSGLPGHYMPAAIATVPYPFFCGDMIADMADEYPVFPPNLIDSYNNNGFTLMERVLAEISGRTFVEELTDDVLHTLGMTNSFYLTEIAQLDIPARSVSGENVYPTEVLNVYASGGIYSSANDMRNAVEMLLAEGMFRGEEFLSTNALSAMLTYQSTNTSLSMFDPFFKVGLGFDSVAGADLAYAGRSYYKGGDTMTHHSWLEIMPDHGLGVAVMANGGAPSRHVAQKALMLALRDKFNIPLPTNAVPAPDSPRAEEPPYPWEQIEGYYASVSRASLVTVSDGHLTLYMDPTEPDAMVYTNLVPHENGWFWEPEDPDFQVSFTNVIDRLFATVRKNSGRYWSTILLGERIEPEEISEKWLSRSQKTWIPADLDPFNFNWPMHELCKLELEAENGFLLFIDTAFHTVNDQLAMPFIVGRNDMGSLRVVEANEEEWLRVSGIHYRATEHIPVLSAPGSTNAVLTGNIIGWHKVPKAGGGRLELSIIADPMPQVHVMDQDFTPVDIAQPANGRFIAAPTGDVYVAITKNVEGGEHYTLRALWRAVNSDYTGDNRSNPTVYSEDIGAWYILGADGNPALWEEQWGGPGFIPMPGDFTGNGVSDIAVYQKETGAWFIKTMAEHLTAWDVKWGFSGALPVYGDFTGNGVSDLAVYQKETGLWFIRDIDENIQPWSSTWGGPGFIPVPGDFTGNGVSDLAVYHEETGAWFISSTDNLFARGHSWGGPGFIPVPGDFTGNGISDLAVYHEETGSWFIKTMDGHVQLWNTTWGGPGFIPVPGDFTGNGFSDLAVYHEETGAWFILTVSGELVEWDMRWGGPGLTPAAK